MGRTILGMLVGVVVAVATVALMEQLAYLRYPLPPELLASPGNGVAIAQFIVHMPVPGLLLILLSWSTGSFVGALAAAKIARHQTAAALLVALVVMAAVVAMIATASPPAWLAAGGLIIPIPLALLAVRLVYRRHTLPRV